MSKFKVGDKVRLVDAGAAESRGIFVPQVHFPVTATVEEVGTTEGKNSWEYVRIKEDNISLSWPVDALELVEDTKEETVKTFNIGDKVRVNGKANSAFFKEGAEGVVTDANPEDFEVQFYKGEYDSDYAGVWYVDPEVVELIEETEEEAPEENLFKVGQTVWCLIFGKGEVSECINHHNDDPYNVYVVFEDANGRWYTQEGKYYEDANRTLFFSEPKIEAETKPPFEAKLIGKEVLIENFNGLMHKGKVVKEDAISIQTDKLTHVFLKEDIEVYLLEQISL